MSECVRQRMRARERESQRISEGVCARESVCMFLPPTRYLFFTIFFISEDTHILYFLCFSR